MPRLHTFLTPWVRLCQGQAAAQHAQTSVCGRRSDVERQNIAALASRCGPSRRPLPSGMGGDAWDDPPWREAVRRQGKTPVGPSAGVWGCDPAGCPQCGRASVGVARPWGGRRGQVAHGQGALSWGSVSRTGHPWVATRRSRPQAWPQEQARRDNAGGPTASRASRTRPPVALARRAHHGAARPPRGLAGDDERGRP
jgi:SRSO17 transposase